MWGPARLWERRGMLRGVREGDQEQRQLHLELPDGNMTGPHDVDGVAWPEVDDNE